MCVRGIVEGARIEPDLPNSGNAGGKSFNAAMNSSWPR